MGLFNTGITSDLVKRVSEHKNEIMKGFASKYHVKKLVYYEIYDDAETAIHREKYMKKWNRDWKMKRINQMNPEWRDLYDQLS